MKDKRKVVPIAPGRIVNIGFIVVALFLILTGIMVLVINGIVCHQARQHFITLEEVRDLDADCIVVLGARVYDDGRLSGVLRDRADQGIAAYFAGASEVLLFSGDHGQDDYDEVNALKGHALSAGVPVDAIFLDHAGFSTYESMYRLRDVFGAKKVLIITQEYHMYRALFDAQALGMEAYGLTSDLHIYGGQTRFELREVAARTKDYLYCKFYRPKPTYLGDPIDLSGSGRQTHDK